MNEISELSEREIEILKLVATGLSNKEIAYQLKISPNTVKVHLKNIFAKIGAVSRTEAAMFAVRQGWVEGGQQVALEVAEKEEVANSGKVTPTFSPLLMTLLGAGGVALLIVLVMLMVNLARPKNAGVVEVIVTPTPEPVEWELVTQMPEAKKSMAYAAVDNKIYIIGGETPNGISDRVDIYDTLTGQWSVGARKPTPVSEACGAYLGGKIIVAGGKTSDGKVTNAVEAYDVAEDRWEELPRLPNPLTGVACLEYEGDFYLFGGWDTVKAHSDMLYYSISDGNWGVAGKIGTLRAYSAASGLNHQIYLIGGWDGKNILDSLDVISLRGASVPSVKLDSLSDARYRLTSQGVLDKLYVIGGTNETESIVSSYELDPKSGIQRLIENPGNRSWFAQGVVSLGEYLYGFGGELGGKLASDLYRLRVLYTILLPIVQ